jgi:hypothetical protein
MAFILYANTMMGPMTDVRMLKSEEKVVSRCERREPS